MKEFFAEATFTQINDAGQSEKVYRLLPLPILAASKEEATPIAEQKFQRIAKAEKLNLESFVVRTKDEEKVRRDLDTANLK